MTIGKGSSITFRWMNTGNTHSVTTKSGPTSFDSNLHGGNFTYAHKFKKAGTYSLFCMHHPDTMKLTVKVK
jgi:plastocyanin